ncbi:MAG: hypothetical protein HYU02_05620 [Thaumarchaeota archaeon]|nr:hypothetical protein [Nitrososphaerota archaeon]
MVDYTFLIPVVSILISTLGVSVIFKDYVGSMIAGIVLRYVKHIKSARRIKIIANPIIKGDVIDIGPLRTTLMEVGDGERLPSVRTGRLVKVPNSFLITNPVVVYGDTIIDEVVAYLKPPLPNLDMVIKAMKDAIVMQGHRVIEVGLYQKEDHLVVHGIFEAATIEMTDERSKILKSFIESSQALHMEAHR